MALELNKSNWHEFADELAEKLTSYGDAGNKILLDQINSDHVSKPPQILDKGPDGQYLFKDSAEINHHKRALDAYANYHTKCEELIIRESETLISSCLS
jgi:hypothetical protein